MAQDSLPQAPGFFPSFDERPPSAGSDGSQPSAVSAEPPAWFNNQRRQNAETKQSAASGETVAATSSRASARRGPTAERSSPAGRRRASGIVIDTAATPRAKPVAEDPAADEEEVFEWVVWWRNFRAWLHEWFTGSGGRATAVSTVTHAVLLLVFALWIVGQNQQEELVATALPPDDEIVDFQQIDTEMDFLKEIAEIPDPLKTPAPEDRNVMDALDLTGMTNLGAGTDLGEDGGGEAFTLPKRVFSKGSFTVWTEPNDPSPGENYHIVIRIALEKASVKAGRYPLADLSGSIVGTDGYDDSFPKKKYVESTKYLDIRNRHAYYRHFVPGAFKLVKDTIKVRSKMLNEEQEIEIVF